MGTLATPAFIERLNAVFLREQLTHYTTADYIKTVNAVNTIGVVSQQLSAK